MSPPVSTPIPRFIADSTREPLPYGRWAQQLREKFASACEPLGEEAKASGLQEVLWFPERTWGGRVYIPATARAESTEGGQPVEYFGFVSHARGEGGEPTDLRAKADFTDIVAEQNPDWKIDLNEEVIGSWRGEAQREGEVTLVWGTPMVPNSFAVTAELDREVVDQGRVSDDRFTLLAVDAVKGFGDDLYLEVRLWDKRGNELAAESLYDEPEAPQTAPTEPR
jgi:hypothetical protein